MDGVRCIEDSFSNLFGDQVLMSACHPPPREDQYVVTAILCLKAYVNRKSHNTRSR
ncbi:hypothetical protein KIN20_007904 [Parelaphostrongylus tenuis]|uniref:Uncharacterized protein n=1 Tax=Parelaphostrongylus tenuis TaxID=148309 RepID=A0AAD5M8R4_PARTN|nr:hypothetical protein KIN20_007904 [Parelaphostrongylus tenuis]